MREGSRTRSELILHAGGPQVGTRPICDGLLKSTPGKGIKSENSPGVKGVDWPCALSHCPVEDKLEESHKDANSGSYQIFTSLPAPELKILPRKINSYEEGWTLRVVSKGPLGHCDWPLTRERTEKVSNGKDCQMQQVWCRMQRTERTGVAEEPNA